MSSATSPLAPPPRPPKPPQPVKETANTRDTTKPNIGQEEHPTPREMELDSKEEEGKQEETEQAKVVDAKRRRDGYTSYTAGARRGEGNQGEEPPTSVKANYESAR